MGDQKGNWDRRDCYDPQSGRGKQENGWNAETEHPVKNDKIFPGTHLPDTDGIDQRKTPKGRKQENKTGNHQKAIVVHELVVYNFHPLKDRGNKGLIRTRDKKKGPEQKPGKGNSYHRNNQQSPVVALLQNKNRDPDQRQKSKDRQIKERTD